MKQSRATSLLKSLISTAAGFSISLCAQLVVFPLFGFNPPLSTNFFITGIFTVLSIARGYLLERLFEMMGWRFSLSPFALAALAERRRQIEVEGWTAEHDDMHSPGQLAAAGGAYAVHAGTRSVTTPHDWPWGENWWKPSGFRRDLVKACALILAEGEKFDRDRKRGRGR